MQKIVDFSAAFVLFFRSFSFIRQHFRSLGRYLIGPVLCSLFCLILLIWGGYVGLFQLVEFLVTYLLGYEINETSAWVSFFISVISLSSSIIFTLFLYRLLASIIVIPFLGPLLSKIEDIMIGQSIEVSLKEEFRNAIYGIGAGLRITLYSLLILILSLFTGPLQIPINFIAQSYFMGRASFDYIFEKASPDLGKRKELLRKHRFAILGNGCAYFLFLLFPILGILFGPIFALNGAARWYHKGEKAR